MICETSSSEGNKDNPYISCYWQLLLHFFFFPNWYWYLSSVAEYVWFSTCSFLELSSYIYSGGTKRPLSTCSPGFPSPNLLEISTFSLDYFFFLSFKIPVSCCVLRLPLLALRHSDRPPLCAPSQPPLSLHTFVTFPNIIPCLYKVRFLKLSVHF